MNRKNSHSQKKLAILPIMLVIMLLTTGAAYAYWYDSLTISGDVTTSNFAVEFSIPTTGHGDDEWKDVVDLTLGEDLHITMDNPDWDSLTITVDGAYPCYHAWIRIGIVCRGLIPAHLNRDVGIGIIAPPELEVWITDEYGDPAFPVGWQLHEGEEYFIFVHFHVFEDDGAGILPEQGATYTFTITIPLIQYNYDY